MDRNVVKVKTTVEEFNKYGERVNKTVTIEIRKEAPHDRPRYVGFTLPSAERAINGKTRKHDHGRVDVKATKSP